MFRLSLPSLLYNITFFLLSKHDFHNPMFVLNSWHYFEVQCMPNRTATPEVVKVLPCPTRSMGAGECRRPCGTLVLPCKYRLFGVLCSRLLRFVCCFTPQTCEVGTRCPFTKGLHTLDVDLQMCQEAFGISPDQVREQVRLTNLYYGGDRPRWVAC